MSGEAEPTAWELHRADKAIIESLRDIRAQMLTAERFEEYVRGIGHRVSEVEARQNTDANAATAVHGELARKIEAVESRVVVKIEAQADRADTLERTARELKVRIWLAIGMAVLAGLIGLASAVILRGMGAA